MIVRARTDGDLDDCEHLAVRVHDLDNYPAYLPGDLRTFIATPDALQSWVAEVDGEVVGHVALHPSTSSAVLALASEATGLQPDQFGVVARLLVSPSARRRGVGRALLLTAATDATHRAMTPILDVVTSYAPAIRLYEGCGWVRAGKVTVEFGDGATIDEYVYLGPRNLDGSVC